VQGVGEVGEHDHPEFGCRSQMIGQGFGERVDQVDVVEGGQRDQEEVKGISHICQEKKEKRLKSAQKVGQKGAFFSECIFFLTFFLSLPA